MIHNNSADPVLIKKISLRVWTLRDELKSVIHKRSDGGKNINLDELVREYQTKGDSALPPDSDDTEVKDAADLDDSGEDEMAKALAEAEAEEDSDESSEGESDESTENQSEEDIPSNVVSLEVDPEEKNGKVLIKQRIPDIPEENVSQGKAILAEIYMDQMYFFTEKEYLIGQSIVIDFQVPKRFVMNATVVFCRTYNMKSRIISKNKMPFRIGIKFSYLKDGERTALRQFVSSIEPDFEKNSAPAKQEAAPAESGGSGGDEFDIFDDLDE